MGWKHDHSQGFGLRERRFSRSVSRRPHVMETTPPTSPTLALELQACMTEIGGQPFIKHWLVQCLWDGPDDNARLNDWLEKATFHLESLLEDRNWQGAMCLYQRAWRLDRFEHLATRSKYAPLMTDEEYWATLGFVLIDQEDSYRQRATLSRLLIKTKRSKESRHLLMTAEDRQMLSEMPETLSIYRGCQSFNRQGWSWTLDKDKAEWFSNRRYKGRPIVLAGEVSKQDVLAYFSGRGESEILVQPTNIRGIVEIDMRAAKSAA